MFRKLCGESALQNVVIVTNMWGDVEYRVGEEREAELKEKDKFFKPVLDQHAHLARHTNTVDSAQRILRLILHNRPVPLCIQVELVDERKNMSKTSAGEELNQELNAQIRKHTEDKRALEQAMQQAMKDKDEEIRKEMEEETKKMQDEIERIVGEAGRLASDCRKKEQEVTALETQLAEKGAASCSDWPAQLARGADFFSRVLFVHLFLVATGFQDLKSSAGIATSSLIATIASEAKPRNRSP